MSTDQKLLEALLSLLDSKLPVNKHSLSKKAGVARTVIDYRIKKFKEFTDVEICS